jgi:hypothetical protein
MQYHTDLGKRLDSRRQKESGPNKGDAMSTHVPGGFHRSMPNLSALYQSIAEARIAYPHLELAAESPFVLEDGKVCFELALPARVLVVTDIEPHPYYRLSLEVEAVRDLSLLGLLSQVEREYVEEWSEFALRGCGASWEFYAANPTKYVTTATE